jgi:hypothetical protein
VRAHELPAGAVGGIEALGGATLAGAVNEILPGVVHWTVRHERIGIDVSSYYLIRERVAIDPMLPAQGLAWFEERGTPTAILLTNRHHYRTSGALVDAFGCTVHCHRAGLHEFSNGEPVELFDFGAELPGGPSPARLAQSAPRRPRSTSLRTGRSPSRTGSSVEVTARSASSLTSCSGTTRRR